MEQLDLRATRRASARALYGRSKVVLAGFLGDAVIGLITLLWEPWNLARWFGWMPRWAWGIVAAAGFIWLTFVAFHRMRVDLVGEIGQQGEKTRAANDRLSKLLGGGPETGPGIVVEREAPRNKPRRYVPPGMVGLMPADDDRASHECELSLRVMREVTRPAIYLWADSPIYSASGKWKSLTGDRVSTLKLKPARRLSRWVELFGGPPIPKGKKIEILLGSPQPIRVLRVALEPEWEVAGD